MPSLFFVSLTLNLLFILTAILLIILYPRIIERFFIPPGYERRSSIFENNPVQQEDTVFLGDSITEWFPLDEMFSDLQIKNRGISGDTTDGVLRRLYQVIGGQPRRVFLMIGTNDIGFGHPQSRIIVNYEKILTRIQAESPQTAIFVLSILPRHRRYDRRIQTTNQEIAVLAKKYDCMFIDLFPHFADEHGGLHSEFTNDKLHLLAVGYAQYTTLISPFVYGD